jgi:hypothetical protein
MTAQALVLVWMASMLTAAPAGKAAEAQPKLRFTQDGKDLVVTTTVEVTDAPHVLWTHAEVVTFMDPHLEGPRHPPELGWVELQYKILQCRDDPMLLHQRHRKKKVEIAWRVADHQKADVRYRVVEQFTPSAAELKDLALKLVVIADQTERRKHSPLATP